MKKAIIIALIILAGLSASCRLKEVDDNFLLYAALAHAASLAAKPGWQNGSYLKAANTSQRDRFGSAVALDKDTIVVGAPLEGSSTNVVINGTDCSATNNFGISNGAAYVFARTSSSSPSYLKAPNTSEGDQFGYSVSVSGALIAAGAPGEDSAYNAIIENGDFSPDGNWRTDAGAAYVFARTADSTGASFTWSHQAYIKAPSTTNYDEFGRSVALQGDTLVVGAPGEDSNTTAIINGTNLSATNDSGSDTGAAYVYVRSATADATSGNFWGLGAYLKAPNASNKDRFGASVAQSGDTIVVGAPGEDSSTTAVINSTDLSATDDSAPDAGAVYVFTRVGGAWTLQAYLKAPNASPDDQFGHAVAIDGDTIVVGSVYEDSTTTSIINGADLTAANDSGIYNGAAYVFVRTGSSWSFQSYLKAPNNTNDDNFSWSVAVSGDTIAIGAPGEDSSVGIDLTATNDSGLNPGAAYVFARSGTTWSYQAYLKSLVPGNDDKLGWSLALDGTFLVVGAPGENGSDPTTPNVQGDANGAARTYFRQ